jgi:lysozyme
MTKTKAQCDTLLREELGEFAYAVDTRVKVRLNEDQRTAMIALTYNIGVGAFERSTLLRKANAGDCWGARAEFPKWNKVNGEPVKGLTNRRLAEQRLFACDASGRLSPKEGRTGP